MSKVYLVEDESGLSSLVVKYLIKEGHEVCLFDNGEDAMKHVEDNTDLWILDIMLPGGISGYDLIKQIRLINHHVPVIFTSARDQDIDRVLGLELGGDDYLSKPYSLRELMLRVNNLLVRSKQENNGNMTITHGPYSINMASRLVKEGETVLQLTSKEYDLLAFLLANHKKSFKREEILQAIWGGEYDGSDRVVDDLMRRLRKKMPQLRVETVYGLGYRLL